MKILIDLTSLADNFSGIELYAQSVALEMIKNQEDFFVLVFKNSIPEVFSNKKQNTEYLIINGKNKLLFNQFILPWKLRKVKADRYLFLAFTEPFFWFRRNTFNAIHDVSCWDCPGSNKWYMILYWKMMFKKVSLRSGTIFTVSNFSKERIVDILNIDPNRIVVTYSAPSNQFVNILIKEENIQRIKEKYSLPDKYILTLSTIEPRKNLYLLLKSYSSLISNNLTDVDLVIAGRNGWKNENLLQDLTSKLLNKIHFTGFIDSDDLPYIYKLSTLFVFPSLYEGFGVPPLEAIFQGSLVVSSNANAMKEVLENSVIFFNNNDGVDCSKKIIEALNLSSIEKSKLLSKKSVIMKKYSWDKITNSIYLTLK